MKKIVEEFKKMTLKEKMEVIALIPVTILSILEIFQIVGFI